MYENAYEVGYEEAQQLLTMATLDKEVGGVQGWMVIHALFLSTSIKLESFQVRRHFCIICFINKDIKAERNMNGTTVQLSWTNGPPNLGVLGPNLTSAKLHEQMLFSSSFLFSSSPLGKILPGSFVSGGRRFFLSDHLGALNILAATSSLGTVYSFSTPAPCESVGGHRAESPALSRGGDLPFCDYFRFIT